MELRQLRYFTVLAEELHFRRSAELLNITQAPLSVAIQNLERELGGQLFLRTQRRVALTELGVAFREHALAVLGRLEIGVADVRERASGHAGLLRIGFTAASALLPFFPEMISKFRTRFPGVRVSLHDLPSANQIRALLERQIDVGIIRSVDAPHPSNISLTKLLEDQLVVAMHRHNHLHDRASLTIADLRDEPLIFYPPQSGVGIYERFMISCAGRGFVPNIVQEATDPSTIVGLAATGFGVAVVPSELQCINVPNILFRPLNGPEAITGVYLAARAGEASALIASFRQMAQAAISRFKSIDNPQFESSRFEISLEIQRKRSLVER